MGEKLEDIEYFDLENYIYGLFAEMIEEAEMNLLDKKNIISICLISTESLTEKQKQYFREYYFQDLSLAEMGEAYKVSRTQFMIIFEKLKRSSISMKKNLVYFGNSTNARKYTKQPKP